MIFGAIRRFFRNWWRARRDSGQSIGEAFYQLVQDYDLNGKVDLKECMQGYLRHWTLVPILPTIKHRWALVLMAEEGKLDPLPPAFVREVQELASRYQRRLRRIAEDACVTFSVHPTGMTLQEIHADQQAWNNYCRGYND